MTERFLGQLGTPQIWSDLLPEDWRLIEQLRLPPPPTREEMSLKAAAGWCAAESGIIDLGAVQPILLAEDNGYLDLWVEAVAAATPQIRRGGLRHSGYEDPPFQPAPYQLPLILEADDRLR